MNMRVTNFESQCDRTLPACLACARARRPCEGYPSDTEVRAFIHLDANNISRPNKKQILCEALAADPSSVRRGDGRYHPPPLCDPNTQGFDDRYHPRPPSCDVMTWMTEQTLQLGGVNVASVSTDFRRHVESLWRTFLVGYCHTPDYWPPGCSLLAFRDQTLDFALVALSAQRLALDLPPGSALRHLGLTAYNKSINLYRRRWVMHADRDKCATTTGPLTAMLAVTSTVYALLEASLMQPEDIATFGWGRSAHFDGALGWIRECGPHPFSTDPGLHLVFKKIREMGAFLAVSRHEQTFLASKEWMLGPWTCREKTWRDGLYDLVIDFSDVLARSGGEDGQTSDILASCRGEDSQTNDISARPRGGGGGGGGGGGSGIYTDQSTRLLQEVIQDLLTKTLEIEARLDVWRSSWRSDVCGGDDMPSLMSEDCTSTCTSPCSCPCSSPLFSCICAVRLPAKTLATDIDLTLLQVECWALQLVICVTLRKWVAATDPDSHACAAWAGAGADAGTAWAAQLDARSSQIVRSMEMYTTSTSSGRSSGTTNLRERSSGITEHVCRTTFPAWALSQYRRMC